MEQFIWNTSQVRYQLSLPISRHALYMIFVQQTHSIHVLCVMKLERNGIVTFQMFSTVLTGSSRDLNDTSKRPRKIPSLDRNAFEKGSNPSEKYSRRWWMRRYLSEANRNVTLKASPPFNFPRVGLMAAFGLHFPGRGTCLQAPAKRLTRPENPIEPEEFDPDRRQMQRGGIYRFSVRAPHR